MTVGKSLGKKRGNGTVNAGQVEFLNSLPEMIMPQDENKKVKETKREEGRIERGY